MMNLDSDERVSTGCACMLLGLILVFTLSGCTGSTPVFSSPTTPIPIATETIPPTSLVLNTPSPTCVNGLAFLSDLTIADDSVVTPGSRLDKQWLVQNSGSCNWDGRYRLRLINGVTLGATPEQTLYPARAGLQARVQILFTAPPDAGTYTSMWQAFDDSGNPFGDSFYIKVIVQP